MLTKNWKSKQRLKMIAQANFGKGDKFVTLTFNDQNGFDLKNLSEANNRYQLFIRRLSRKVKKLKYIGVPEYQERGSVHYHVLCNLPYMKKSKLAELWTHGFVKVNRINDSGHVVNYISKYLTKHIEDIRFANHRKYYCSRNLIKPVRVGYFTAKMWLKRVRDAKLKPISWGQYMSLYNGLIATERYNLAIFDKDKK